MVYLNIKFTNYKGSKTWQLDLFISFPNLAMLHHYSLLHWLPVEYRIKYKLLLFTYKGIHQMAPQYINETFTRKSRWYRSQLCSVARDIVFVNGNVSGDIVFDDIIYLSVPRTKSVTFEQRSLAVAGPHLWNSLPTDIKMQNSLDCFKSKIKTYVLKQAFNV